MMNTKVILFLVLLSAPLQAIAFGVTGLNGGGCIVYAEVDGKPALPIRITPDELRRKPALCGAFAPIDGTISHEISSGGLVPRDTIGAEMTKIESLFSEIMAAIASGRFELINERKNEVADAQRFLYNYSEYYSDMAYRRELKCTTQLNRAAGIIQNMKRKIDSSGFGIALNIDSIARDPKYRDGIQEAVKLKVQTDRIAGYAAQACDSAPPKATFTAISGEDSAGAKFED